MKRRQNMKKMRKIFAVLLTLAMVLGMSMTSFAANATTITVNNLDAKATLTSVQIIAPDQTTETGWAFANNAAASFKKVGTFANLTDQQIIWKLIKYADANATVPSGTEAANAADFQAAMVNVEKDYNKLYI